MLSAIAANHLVVPWCDRRIFECLVCMAVGPLNDWHAIDVPFLSGNLWSVLVREASIQTLKSIRATTCQLTAGPTCPGHHMTFNT